MRLLNLIRRAAPAPYRSPEAAFWTWFAANEAKLWEFEDDVENVIHAVLARMWHVNPRLSFDFGPLRDGRREFVVSAGGTLPVFPAVVRLTAAAPPLPRWIITPFRPRRALNGAFVLTCGDTLEVEQVRFAASPVGGRLDVKLFIPGYRRTPLDEFEIVGNFLVNLAVGEFDAETRLARVSAGPLQADVEGRPLAELPALVDALPGD